MSYKKCQKCYFLKTYNSLLLEICGSSQVLGPVWSSELLGSNTEREALSNNLPQEFFGLFKLPKLNPSFYIEPLISPLHEDNCTLEKAQAPTSFFQFRARKCSAT